MQIALWMLAGIGVWSVALVLIVVAFRIYDDRRQERLAEALAALRFEDISPVDQAWAQRQWPENTKRAQLLARSRKWVF